MLEYTRLPSEPPRCADGAPRPPPEWPSAAQLEFEGVSACYRPGLPPVLSDLTFAVPVREGATSAVPAPSPCVVAVTPSVPGPDVSRACGILSGSLGTLRSTPQRSKGPRSSFVGAHHRYLEAMSMLTCVTDGSEGHEEATRAAHMEGAWLCGSCHGGNKEKHMLRRAPAAAWWGARAAASPR